MASAPAAATMAVVRERSSIQRGFGPAPSRISELHKTRAIASIRRSLRAVVRT